MFSILKRHDWLLNAAILAMAAASLATIWSVRRELFWEQFVWFLLGIAMIVFFSRVDLRPLANYRVLVLVAYLASLVLLAVTLATPPMRGVRAWLPVGPFRFQTSELAKVVLLVLLAFFFARQHVKIARVKILLRSLLYAALPVALVLLEPDWGTALVFLGIWAGFLLMSGIRFRHLAIGFGVALLLGALSWNFALAPYQKERVIGFFNPSYDPLGVNYSVIQSKIAIGSAGLWGKGFGQGTQAQLGFLPEPATDFIFAAFVEEWGLLGGAALLAAFSFLVFRVIAIGWRARDNVSRFIALGAAFVFLVEFFLNVGSAVGLLPVVGIPFPFFSYGGSNLVTKSVLLGFIQSIAVHASFLTPSDHRA